MNIFEFIYTKYNSQKPIRLIELFGGYGSQHFSLEYLGLKIEHWKLCEWAIKSIQAYKDGHYYNDNIDYSKYMNREQLIDYLFDKGISMDYDKPMTYEQIKRQKEAWLRNVYNNIISTNNLVNIQQVKGDDLQIVNTDKYDYVMTYSFPCQDLSLAGKQKGMSRDSGTRSGMLWEVERILDELYQDKKELPQILLMENVPQVIGTENVEFFNEWQLKLEKLGYKSYHSNLIATNYGIPQTRNRTFMISILGDYSYSFPQSIPLKHKLKDLLENKVDKKYYLSDKMINCFMSESKNSKFPRKERFLQQLNTTNNRNIAGVVTTCAGNRATDNFILSKETICINSKVNGKQPSLQDRVYDTNGMATTLTTCFHPSIIVKEATKQGYAIATPGDSINIAQPNSKTRRGRVGKGVAQTLLTQSEQVTIDNSKIRKLTPKECFRLMGVKDEDYERIAKNQSDSSLYHLAGDSIVTTVLMAIFGELYGIDWKEKINNLLESYK